MRSVGQHVEVDNRIIGTNNFIELNERNRPQGLQRYWCSSDITTPKDTKDDKVKILKMCDTKWLLWQDGEGQAMLGHDGPCGGEGQARGLARRTKSGGEGRVTALSWWTVRDHLKLQVTASIIWRIYVKRFRHLCTIKRERWKEGIPIVIILFLFTFEVRNAVLLRRMQRRGVCVCLGAQSDLS